MRNTGPVTNVERHYGENERIVSKTDSKGRITYVNHTFEEISGFRKEELIGKAHNIVRHPDMPPEAFEDLWTTIKTGKSWRGLVKNRCKNGDHYWVEANVNPIVVDGQITGYVSMRSRPTREQTEAAEDLYRLVREGKVPHMRIKEGKAVYRGLRGWLGMLGSLSVRARLSIGIAMLTFTAIGLHFLGATTGVMIGVNSALLVAMELYMARIITRPLSQAVQVANAISAGDLDVEVEVRRDDEFGKLLYALDIMKGTLKGIVDDVESKATEFNHTAIEIAAGNDSLSQRTEEQSSSLEETASSMEELTSTVKQNAENADHANRQAEETRKSAEKGGEVVAKAVDAMSAINQASKKIADIIGVIDEIAFQTNLLALNAAVEAARAGEQGRGFAVVAGEVRNLAQRSATSAKEIKELINDSVTKVDAGTELVNASGRRLTEIVDGVSKMTTIVAEIATASREQTAGIEQINQAVIQMDDLTQQNAGLVERAARASRTLESESQHLIQAMEFFKNVQTPGTHSRAPRARSAAPATTAARVDEQIETEEVEVPAAILAQGRQSAGAGSEWSQF
ncbi:MAG: PAS domain-containing protein [Gammaproteobacteria bacterium]|nr:PAS domain-containing protein [Gammaproteobacteria bacterium]